MRGTSTDDPSGHALAEAAYDAGAVEPSESTPNCDVELRFVVRGGVEHAHAMVDQFAVELLARADVVTVGWTVTPR